MTTYSLTTMNDYYQYLTMLSDTGRLDNDPRQAALALQDAFSNLSYRQCLEIVLGWKAARLR